MVPVPVVVEDCEYGLNPEPKEPSEFPLVLEFAFALTLLPLLSALAAASDSVFAGGFAAEADAEASEDAAGSSVDESGSFPGG